NNFSRKFLPSKIPFTKHSTPRKAKFAILFVLFLQLLPLHLISLSTCALIFRRILPGSRSSVATKHHPARKPNSSASERASALHGRNLECASCPYGADGSLPSCSDRSYS